MMVAMVLRRIALILTLIVPTLSAGQLKAGDVVVLYNAKSPESRALAVTYREARRIPEENLVGLDLPLSDDISRVDYESLLATPLRAHFDQKGWWQRGRDSSGNLLAGFNRMRVIACMKGVPLRIAAKPKSDEAPQNPTPFTGHDEASVDSELAMLSLTGPSVPLEGPMKNPYYQRKESIVDANLPFLMLVARLDAATVTTCERMLRDAIATEETGLWGRAYVDIANKVPEGDGWLEAVIKANQTTGIPTVVDRFNETLPAMYPMTDAAWYYGWYDWHVSGPFLNPAFRFRRGAVAMHLHSFSAEQIRNPNANWSAALLERGAAATIGNVYEPYLHLTHHFDILHERLLAGATFVEAAWAAMPATSWQGVVFGDPLYRPCLHLSGDGVVFEGDKDYRALRMATVSWGKDAAEWRKQIGEVNQRKRNGVMAEALALDAISNKDNVQAAHWLRTARQQYIEPADRARQELQLVALERAAGNKEIAVQILRDLKSKFASQREAEAMEAWLKLLDPPPPPPPAAAPGKP